MLRVVNFRRVWVSVSLKLHLGGGFLFEFGCLHTILLRTSCEWRIFLVDARHLIFFSSASPCRFQRHLSLNLLPTNERSPFRISTGVNRYPVRSITFSVLAVCFLHRRVILLLRLLNWCEEGGSGVGGRGGFFVQVVFFLVGGFDS